MSKNQQPALDTDEGTKVLLSVALENVEIDEAVLAKVVAHEVEGETKQTHWTQTLWGTHVRWACTYCPFDTLDGEEAMAEHYRAQHAPPPPPAPMPVVLVSDRFGNPVR